MPAVHGTRFHPTTLSALGYSIESIKLFHAVLDVLREVWEKTRRVPSASPLFSEVSDQTPLNCYYVLTDKRTLAILNSSNLVISGVFNSTWHPAIYVLFRLRGIQRVYERHGSTKFRRAIPHPSSEGVLSILIAAISGIMQ